MDGLTEVEGRLAGLQHLRRDSFAGALDGFLDIACAGMTERYRTAVSRRCPNVECMHAQRT